MGRCRGAVGLMVLASLSSVAGRLGAQDLTNASFTHGTITFSQGTQVFTWPLSTDLQATYAEFPAPDSGFQFMGIYQHGGCNGVACPTILVGVRSMAHESGAFTSWLSIEVSGSPAGDVLFNGAPKQCRVMFTRHGVGGVAGTGDCTGVPFIKAGAPVGKFTFSAAP